eukprot:4868230-Amphidinium_carterae.1
MDASENVCCAHKRGTLGLKAETLSSFIASATQRNKKRQPIPLKPKENRKFQEHRNAPKYWKNEQNGNFLLCHTRPETASTTDAFAGEAVTK